MANILSFLKKNGKKSLEKLPFCEADIITLGVLSYFNYEKVNVTKRKDLFNNVTNILDFKKESSKNFVTNHFLKPKEYIKFIDVFNKTTRYENLKVGYFEENKSKKAQVQFFGLTFIFDDKVFVVFRGTDRSVVGWKEDFNLVLEDVIPSQEEAKNYLKKIINIVNRDVYVLGHSKGGNLAYYAFYYSEEEIKDKVIKVYNLDGPGFRFDTTDLYNKYKEKLVKVVPNDDVVGMLLQDPSELMICYSKELNVNAHDLLTWQFNPFSKYQTLSKADKITVYSETLKNTINEFIEKIGLEKVADVKEAIFELIQINKVEDVILVYQAALNNIIKTLNIYKKENEEKSKEMEDLIKIFFRIYFENFRKVQESRRKEVLNKFLNFKGN